jgi:hypothetical protein
MMNDPMPVAADRADHAMRRDSLKERLDAATQITNLFKFERYVYVSCCVVAVALLFFVAWRVVQRETPDYPGLGALFGSGGLITYSTGRLILMWNKIVELTLGVSAGEGRNDN